MTLMVAYAAAAEKDPTTAHTIAMDRSPGVAGTGSNIPPAMCSVPIWSGERAGTPGLDGRCETMKLGRATNKTPTNEITPAKASLTVNGS